MFSQSLVEYGALGSIVAGIEHAANSVGDWAQNVGPARWAAAAGVVLLILLLRRRRT